MVFKTIKKDSAPDLVVRQILDQIDNNTLSPGSQLPSQRELAALLGVGRSSIREAVNALVVLGYLVPIQGKGTYIREDLPGSDAGMEKLADAFRAGSIFDLMEARTMLECQSAALAAERGEATQVKKIRAALLEIPDNDEGYTVFLKADLAFHYAVAEAANNVVIREMTKQVLDKLKTHHASLNTDLLSRSYRQESIQSAAKVTEAVEVGDPDSAALWMARHLSAINVELGKLI